MEEYIKIPFSSIRKEILSEKYSTFIQLNRVSVQTSESGTQVAISIESEMNYGTENYLNQKTVISKISRASLDILKVHFRDYTITPEIMVAIRKMKKAQSIE